MKNTTAHHHLEVERHNPDPSFGLDNATVDLNKEKGAVNIAKNPTNKSYLQIILGNIFTFFNILMIAIAVVLFLIVGPKVVTNLMFILIIICNLLIGTIQECKSKRVVEKLKLLNDSKVKVRRNGVEELILPSEVVLDDVIVLSPGDQIPADCIILEEEVVEVNESLLTGESVPVKKSKGDELFAGSFIVSGSVAVRADKIANDTYIQSIESKAKQSKQPKSRLMLAINKIIRTMAFIAIPLAVIVFVNEMLHTINVNPTALPIFPSTWGDESIVSNAVFYGGTAIAYMIPCGMALLASVAMATGVVKLSQTNTLAQNLYSVESLSRVNTLCLDKTGTLTDGTMTLDSFEVLNDRYSEEDVSLLMANFLSAFKSANQTSTALINRFGKLENPGMETNESLTNNALLGSFRERRSAKIEDTIEFSSARKYSAVKFKDKGWYVMGAPEYITEDRAILDRINEFAYNGLRVVLLAKVHEDFDDKDVLPQNRENIAMFIIRDNIRPEVKDTMIWFRNNDVDIKVISGDNIGTVGYIAKQCGIENWDKAFDMSTLTPQDNLEEIVLNNAIFGRVTPDQKADIIAILKKNKRVVGVTGDGLNDLLAFKQADCSIALANGAAATKNVANLILLDSNFANMKEAVFQGRRVVNNIQRSSSLFVMKDFLWLFVTIMPILLGIPHMVQPTVMSIVNIFITGLASLFVALEPDKTRVTGNFYKNVVKRALVAGFYMFIPVLFITVYFILTQVIANQGYNLELMKPIFENGEVKSIGWISVMSLCVTIGGFIIFFENCKPFTKFRKILFAATLAIVLIVLYLIPEYFIMSGTEMLKNTGGFLNIFNYCLTHLSPNSLFAIYRTMSLEQVLVLVGYLLLAYPLYLLNKKVAGWVVDKLLFSNREFLDE